MIALTGLVKHANKAKFLLNDHSSTILTGVGVGGTTATAILTGRASFKAARLIDEELKIRRAADLVYDGEEIKQNEISLIKDLSKTEKVKVVWKLYIPPVGIGVVTITSIIVANRLSARKIAALAVASGISERALQEYKTKVMDKFGERKSQDVQSDIQQDRVNASFDKGGTQVIVASGDVLCYDGLTGRYFTSSVEKIKRAENQLNFELLRHMYASLSEFYERVGLPPTTYSDAVGWHTNGSDGEVNVMLSTVMSPDNRPCIAIDFERGPTPEFWKVHD